MKGKKKIVLIVLIVIIVIAVSAVTIYLLINKTGQDENKINSMDKRIDEIVNDAYIYYLLANGQIPTDTSSVEVEGVTYEYVNIEKIKKIEDINNLVASLFIEDERQYRESKIFNRRSFLELEDGLYVNYDKEDICDITNIENPKSYTYEKAGNDRYRIITNFGDNNVLKENDNWYIQSDVFKCDRPSNKVEYEEEK